MANYSESKGTIVVRAKSKETLENFIYLHVLVNKDISCFTHFDIFEDLYNNKIDLATDGFEYIKSKLDIHKSHTGDLFEVVLEFKDEGRYNYTNTIQDMFLELFDEALEDDNTLIENLRDELKDEYFELLFDITDFEGGYGILYQGEYALIRRDQEVIYEICAEYDYECTDENIEKFGFKGWS